jgi:hypothetical protein
MDEIRNHYWKKVIEAYGIEFKKDTTYYSMSKMLDKNAGTIHNLLNKNKDIKLEGLKEILQAIDAGSKLYAIDSNGKKYML